MILFYSNDLSSNSALLEEDEYHHCCKVLRHKVGDMIAVTDGKGSRAMATLTDISKKIATLELTDLAIKEPKQGHITLAVSPPKNRVRWEWLIEKAVELGVDTIIPLQTQRTERSRMNMERSHKIIRSAALQSMRDFHPSLEENLPFSKLMERQLGQQDKYLAHYNIDNPDLISCTKRYEQATILIGPEGDFTNEEVLLAKDHGFITANISTHRLRTETAAIAVVDQLKGLGYSHQ